MGMLCACGASRLPRPTYVQQPTAALQQADYPPPPGRSEVVPAAPGGDAVWLDGEWVWQGGRYAWKNGRWLTPPPGASFSPWTSVRGEMGTFYIAEGKWRDAKGVEVAEPLALSISKVRAGSVVNSEGEEVQRTPNLRPDTAESLEKQQDRREKRRAKRDGGPPETPSGATPTGTEPKSGGSVDGGASAPVDAGSTD